MQKYASLWVTYCWRNIKLLFVKGLLYLRQMTTLVFIKYSKMHMYVKAFKMEVTVILPNCLKAIRIQWG